MDTFAGGMSSYFGGGKNYENDDDEKEPYAGNWHETIFKKEIFFLLPFNKYFYVRCISRVATWSQTK